MSRRLENLEQAVKIVTEIKISFISKTNVIKSEL